MFTVKATYRQETRKFSFRSSSFPTYDEICHQLYRIFPISQNYYLSKLLFSPESSSSARILIAKEVHSAGEYEAALSTLKSRVYPSALLKFSVFEENSHNTPSVSALDASLPRMTAPPLDHQVQLPKQTDSRSYDVIGGNIFDNVTSANVSVLTSSPSVSPYHIPPPPVIFSYHSDSMSVDQASGSPAVSIATVQPNQHQSMPSSQPQVSELQVNQISRAKTEVQVLVAAFKDDLDRILNNALGSTSSAHGHFPAQPQLGVSQRGPCTHYGPARHCTCCQKVLGSSWFSCEACSFNVCDSCYNVLASAHQTLSGVNHIVSRVTCHGCPVNQLLHTAQGHSLSPPAAPLTGTTCIWTPSSTNVPASPPTGADYHTSRGSIFSQQTATPSSLLVVPVNGTNSGAYVEEDVSLHPPESPESNNYVPDTAPVDEVSPVPAPALPGTSTAGSSTDCGPIHNGVTCDSCGNTIVGVRHKCFDCPNYDLCTACIESGSAERHNPFHVFLDIREPIPVSDGDREGAGDRNASDNARPNEVHSATCDLCDSVIVGVRYKCLNCPDFDTCSSCFTITSEQHPCHSFIRIRRPVDFIPHRSNDALAVHYATCDGCRKAIRGVRYKCMHAACPDFDLCAACEAHPIPVHPITHPFLKLRSPDTEIPVTSSSVPGAPVEPSYGLLRSRSVSPRPYSRGCLYNPSAQEKLCSTSEIRYPSRVPSPTYVPPHINTKLYMRSPSSSPTVLTVQSEKSTELHYGSRSPSPMSGPYNRQTLSPSPRGRPGSRSPLPYRRFGCSRRSSYSRSRSSTPRHYYSQPPTIITHSPTIITVIDSHANPSRDVDGSLRASYTPPPRLSVDEPLEKPSVDGDGITPVMVTDGTEHRSTTSTSRPVSPQSQRPFKLPPLSLDPSADLFHEFWPRVAQELRHLLLQEPVPTASTSHDVDFDQNTSAPEPANAIDLTGLGAIMPQESTGPTTFQTEISQVDPAAVPFGSPVLEVSNAQLSLESSRISVVTGVCEGEDDTSIENPLEKYMPDTSSKIEMALERVEATDVPVIHLSTEEAAPRTSPDKSSNDQPALSAAFVRDNTVPNGQIFPAGAEFVKSWRMVNDGAQDWPEATELVFAAGDSLTRDDIDPQTVKVGTAPAGSEVNIWTGELKAPDAPGKYVGYWRLSDGNGNLFGPGIWIEINVAVLSAQSDTSGESSLASSSIIMPATLNGPLPQPESRLSSASSSPVTTPIVLHSDVDSDSVSLISVPSSKDDDESAWEDSRTHVMVSSPHGMEYVVLYDSSSEEDIDV